MTTENKRDLAADLAICEAATAGYWIQADGSYVLDGTDWNTGGEFVAECERESDAKFIATAREGWPEAIRRAMAAETEVERLKDENYVLTLERAYIQDGYETEVERLKAEVASLKKDKRLITACYDGQSARASDYYREMKRLRSVLERMDDRKNPMMPRSRMARLAIEALDYTEGDDANDTQENNGR